MRAAALLTLVLSGAAALSDADTPTKRAADLYALDISLGTLTLKDGVHLAATYFKPRPRTKGERFPVLFEFLPYRKDDSSYIRDYPLYSYFAKRGFACVKVDIRGTGASEGTVPDREYSEQELDDAVEIIGLLAAEPWSNGSAGMWGISWGGFNAIQVAMRHPPALKAILAAHASDNLYYDGIDYIDGAFHVDSYHLEVHHENGLPKPPDYKLDEAYFKERFESYPWFFTYAKHPLDGPFWRKSALRYDFRKLKVPVYLIGGLLDGYRDSVLRILENATVPVKAEIGPWHHDWPDEGEPGPNYDWGVEATKWWDHWLRGKVNGVGEGKSLALFVRDGHPPDDRRKTTPGEWRLEEWPIQRTSWRRFFPTEQHDLVPQAEKESALKLAYGPGYGIAAGLWWGEPTGDMRSDDAGSLVFDSPELTEPMEIVGFPRVHLRVSADAPVAHWIARVEDVQPNGTVSLVAAALLNAARHPDPLRPEPLVPGQAVDVAFDLHFTTWNFKPGHRIRLAVTNSQFPMIWPTPYAMTTTLHLGEASWVELPAIPFEKRRAPSFVPPEPRDSRPDAKYVDCEEWPEGVRDLRRDMVHGKTSYEWKGECSWEIGERHYRSSERNFYETSDSRPADSRFRGDESHRIVTEHPGRSLELRTVLEVRSDEKSFYVTFTRRLLENETLVREKQWAETIPRQFQ
ncbi:MAG: CocE/NonD family hydrolase [Vicinamibacteria bacterium]